jgi:hypothetical protein
MNDATTMADRYIAVWNETDPARRHSLIKQAWSENGVYVDPLMAAEGHAEIDGLVAAVHSRFPGFRFSLKGKADGYGNNLRFSWALGPEGGESLVEGTDFAVLEGNRLKTVKGFIDKMPAAA